MPHGRAPQRLPGGGRHRRPAPPGQHPPAAIKLGTLPLSCLRAQPEGRRTQPCRVGCHRAKRLQAWWPPCMDARAHWGRALSASAARPQMERDGSGDAAPATTICVDGGVFEHYTAYRGYVRAHLDRLLGPEVRALQRCHLPLCCVPYSCIPLGLRARAPGPAAGAGGARVAVLHLPLCCVLL